jgi:hypothetical protein
MNNLFVNYKERVNQLVIWLGTTSILKFSLALCAIKLVTGAIVHSIKNIFSIPNLVFAQNPITDNYKITVDLAIDALLIAPVLETLLFQAPFLLIYNKLKQGKWIIILLSGLAFGAIHYYSVFYMISTFVMGFIFMYLYILRSEHNTNPLRSMISAHFAINLFIVMATLLAHYVKHGTLI